MNTRELAVPNGTMLALDGGASFLPHSLGEVIEASKLMAQSGAAVPSHCRNAPGACFAIMMRALRWGMDPFAVASKSYQVKDQIIAYEAQLIQAVVNTRAGLVDDLEVTYEGEGQDRRCKVVGTLNRGRRQPREYISPKVKDIKVKNSPLWQSDLDQQLHYFSTRNWARRWCPEVLLGVYTKEEIESGEVVTEADRAQAIEHKLDVLSDDPISDPNEPAPTAPLGARLSYALEKAAVGDEAALTAAYMGLQAEMDAVAENERAPLRELYKAHLARVRGKADHEEVMKLSHSFREPKQEAA